jgi:dTDP-4-amino-4,6-dideoxygalactose transaminase
VAGQPLGAVGDFVLLSFGAGKTIDASLGGLVAARGSLDAVARLDQRLPLFDDRLREKTELFAHFYRLMLHSSFYGELLDRAAAFREFFEDMYLFRLDELQQRRVVGAFARLPESLAARRAACDCYDRHLLLKEPLRAYPWSVGAAPWRYNLLVEDLAVKRRLIEALLAARVRVSTWYPPIHRLFGDRGDYPGAERFARRILNLPLDQGLDEVRRIVAVLKGK